MSRYNLVLVFFFTLALLHFVTCGEDHEKILKQSREELRKNITYYKTENEKLSKELKLEEENYKNTLNNLTIQDSTVYTTIQLETERLEGLIKNLSKIKSEEMKLLVDRNLERVLYLALTLKIKQVAEDNAAMENKRQNGDTDLCFRLQNRPKLRSFRTFSRVLLKNIADENNVELKFLREENNLLKTLLKELKDVHEKAISELKEIMEKEAQELSTIKGNQEDIINKMVVVKNRMQILQEQVTRLKIKNNETREIFNSLKRTYEEYTKDRICFAELNNMFSNA